MDQSGLSVYDTRWAHGCTLSFLLSWAGCVSMLDKDKQMAVSLKLLGWYNVIKGTCGLFIVL